MSDALVLLSGMNCSARMWGEVPDLLRDGPRPPVAVRHGRLDRPTVDGCVDALLAELPARFALAGLSLGGIVAMALVRRAPERVTRLALLATNARGPTAGQRAAWAAQRAALAAGATARDLQRELLPVLLHRRDAARDEAVLALADEVGETVLDLQLAAQESRIDERPGLRGVRVPTLVVAAGQDRLCPVERHQEIAALVPGARLTVLDGAGHLCPLEDPAGVGAALAGWLAADRPPARTGRPAPE